MYKLCQVNEALRIEYPAGHDGIRAHLNECSKLYGRFFEKRFKLEKVKKVNNSNALMVSNFMMLTQSSCSLLPLSKVRPSLVHFHPASLASALNSRVAMAKSWNARSEAKMSCGSEGVAERRDDILE